MHGSLDFGVFAFLSFSLGPAGDCSPYRLPVTDTPYRTSVCQAPKHSARMGGPGLGKGLISECEYNLKSFGCCLLQDVVIKGVSFPQLKQPVQTLYGLSDQIVPKACFPDGIRVSNRPGTKLIHKPEHSM